MANYDNLQVTLNNIDNIHNEYCKNLVLLKQDLDSNIIEIQALYDYIKTYKRIWNVTYNPIEYPCELPKHFIKEYHDHCNYVEKLQIISIKKNIISYIATFIHNCYDVRTSLKNTQLNSCNTIQTELLNIEHKLKIKHKNESEYNQEKRIYKLMLNKTKLPTDIFNHCIMVFF